MIFLLIILIAFSLRAMDLPLFSPQIKSQTQLSSFLKKKKIKDISCAQFIDNNKILITTETPSNGLENHTTRLVLFDTSENVISCIDEGINQYELLSVDSEQNRCFIGCGSHSPIKFDVLLYDFMEKKITNRITAPTNFPGCFCFFDRATKNVISCLFTQSPHEKAYRINQNECCVDEKISSFLSQVKGAVYFYNPDKKTIVGYCEDKNCFYHCSIEKNIGDAVFIEKPGSMGNPSFASNQSLTVFWERGVSKISVLDVLKKTCLSYDVGDRIKYLDVFSQKNVVAIFSMNKKMSYFDIGANKIINGAMETESDFSSIQRYEYCRMLSLSPDEKMVAIILKDMLKIDEVPFEVLYGINSQLLMTIICALDKMPLLQDIRRFVVFKIVEPYLIGRA